MKTTRLALRMLAAALAVIGLGPVLATAPAAPPRTDYLSQLPPLIDRDVFFGDPEIAGAQLSPDGRWISFRKPYRDVMNIWVKPLAAPFDAAHPVTADTERPVRAYFWSEDSAALLYVQDKGGDENYHIYSVDPSAEAEAASGVPPARDLTPLEGIRATIYAVPEKTPGKIVVGLNDRDPALHDVYVLDLKTGARELAIENDTNVAGWVTDLTGKVRLAFRQTEDGGSEILPVKDDGSLGAPLYTCTAEESCEPFRFHKDNRRVYIVSNKGNDVDLMRLMLLDAGSGAMEAVEVDPEGEVDFGGPIFSDVTEELIGTFYVADRVRIYPRTDELRRDLEFLRAELPDGEIDLLSSNESETLHLVAVTRDVNPGSVYLYDRTKRTLLKLYDSRPELPTDALASMQAVRYPARDGSRIPAYLTTPKNVEPRGLPAIVLPHGGPWARDTWGYDALAQFLANRGYAVLQPNFRGSTGYGKRFLNAGNEEWGTGMMQHDLSDGVAYLVGEGIADPQRVAIMGGSYGGYATLAGVTFTPELYAAGVSIVGPSNIITLLDSIPPYWGPIKKMFHTRVGDPADPADRARLEAQSPFFHAGRIKAPLLVIQGANDPRVKKAESDQIVVAMREAERPVEYLVAPDEGHGFAGLDNRLAMFAAIEQFLARHLAGRAQQGASAEVAQRMAELQVDVATVVLPRRDDDLQAARTRPLPRLDASRIEPLHLEYRSDVSIGGQELDVTSEVEVSRATREGRPVWRIEARSSSPMGRAVDVSELDAASLAPLTRRIEQGPVRVALDYADGGVTGTLGLPTGEVPVDIPLEAPVMGSDTALELTLAALPLESGYGTTLRTFDVQTQKMRVWRVEVLGQETIEVPAGSFEAWEVRLLPIDGEGGETTLWISSGGAPRTVKKRFVFPPSLGGGSGVTELTGHGEGG